MRRNLRKITRGYFDVVKPEGDAVRVVGWMFRLDGPFEEIELLVDGRPVAREPAIRFIGPTRTSELWKPLAS